MFIGDNPFSEQETISVSMFLNKIAVDLMGFICIKGFRNLITLPYSNSDYANNHAIMVSGIHKQFCISIIILISKLATIHEKY